MFADDVVNYIQKGLKMSRIDPNWFEEIWYYSRVRDWYYNIRNLLFRRYDLIRTGLPKTSWCDKDYLMLYGMMNLLVDYVEGEKCFETINWDHDDDYKKIAKEIKEIYDWWKNYENRTKEIEKQLSVWHDEFEKRPSKDWLKKVNDDPTPKKEKKEHDKLNKMEEDLDREEQEMLHRLIDIRKYLWT